MRVLNWKRKEGDLESGYRLRVEFGMIISLLVLIVLFNVRFTFKNKEDFTVPEQETVKIQQVIQTKIHQKPPPPPVPQVPVAVSNDAIIKDQLNFGSTELFPGHTLIPPQIAPKAENHKKKQERQIFRVVEIMPKPIGGMESLQKYIQYPELARKAGIEGTVTVQFVVNKKGVPTDLKVLRGIGGGCDEAALNAVRKIRFTPGVQRGRPVPVRMSIPVRFQLQNQ